MTKEEEQKHQDRTQAFSYVIGGSAVPRSALLGRTAGQEAALSGQEPTRQGRQ